MKRSRSSDTFRSRKDEVAPPEGDRFCQTFIKPTQIYRYLRTRFISSPLFLHRNLSYMRGRSARNQKQVEKRKEFAINLMKNDTDKEQSKLRAHLDNIKKRKETFKSNENLVIGFLNFEDDDLDGNVKRVEVVTKLERTSHKRRKEGMLEPNVDPIGRSTVDVKNVNSNAITELPAVYVSHDLFQFGENTQTTFSLSFHIEVSGNLSHNTSDAKKGNFDKLRYCAQLPVFDKQGRNLLLPGMYQITALDPDRVKSSHTSNWEARTESWVEEVNKHWVPTDDIELSNPFSKFEKTAKIIIYLEWSDGLIDKQKHTIPKPKFISDQFNNNNKENSSTINISEDPKIKILEPEVIVKVEPSSERYIFQFVVNQSIKQRMEERTDFVCPWCSVNCIRIYSLMKHLRSCHARFLFQYIDESPDSVRRIDVYVNDSYDGSYSGAPHDVLLGGSKGHPTRRNVATSIMVFRPRKPSFKMNEFAENDDNDLETRQYFSGHNRIYYHSETCIPILPMELDYDSEGEPNPKWLQRTTKQMIDEFIDVNGGEKELMKLWNLHLMKHGFVGDCQIEVACELFLRDHGKELINMNLLRCFIVHLNSLFDFGLISPRTERKLLEQALALQAENFNAEAERKKRKEIIKCNSTSEPRTLQRDLQKPVLKSVPIASKASGKLRASRT